MHHARNGYCVKRDKRNFFVPIIPQVFDRNDSNIQ